MRVVGVGTERLRPSGVFCCFAFVAIRVRPRHSPPKFVAKKHGLYGTWKFILLVRMPLGVVTWTFPVVASMGTVVVISVFETTLKTADVPLNVTLFEPINLLP